MNRRRVQLKELAFARSGDKGDVCNIGLMAKGERVYELLSRAITPEKVKEQFKGIIKGEVEIYPVPNLCSLEIILNRSLGGGATRTLRFDQTGKSMGAALLRMEVDASDALIREAEEVSRAIEKRYGGHDAR